MEDNKQERIEALEGLIRDIKKGGSDYLVSGILDKDSVFDVVRVSGRYTSEMLGMALANLIYPLFAEAVREKGTAAGIELLQETLNDAVVPALARLMTAHNPELVLPELQDLVDPGERAVETAGRQVLRGRHG